MLGWRDRLEDYYWLHDLLRVSVGLPAWAMLWDGSGQVLWRDLSLVLPPLAPYHFEINFSKEGERDRYYQRQMRPALQQGRALTGRLYGVEDLFCPIARQGKGGAVLYIGQFLTRMPSYPELAKEWKRLSGRLAVAGDADFDAWLSTVLKLPYLPPAAVKGLKELAGLYAAHLRGELSRAAIEPRLNRLRKAAFIPYLPHPVWAYQAVGFDRQRPVPWYPSSTLDPWMKEEMGLSRVPTTVLAMLPLDQDPARARVQGRALQLAAWAWCRERGELTPMPLQEEGVAFLVAPLRAGSREQLQALARDLRSFARERFGMRCSIGVGRPVPEGERLFPSYREAVLALQNAVQQDRALLFYDEIPQETGGFSYPRLARAARELGAVFEEGVAEPLKIASDEYVRRVLEFASGRIDAARGQFLAALFHCVEALRRRHTLQEQDLEALARELSLDLEAAQGMVSLLERFNSALRRMLALSLAGSEGRRSLRLQATLEWMRENYADPISLPVAAKHAGLSVPGFTRAFKRATGSAFLPWLRKLRVQQGQRLLRSSPLKVAEIAALCGFRSSHHFIRAFQSVIGLSPQGYRQRAPKAL